VFSNLWQLTVIILQHKEYSYIPQKVDSAHGVVDQRRLIFQGLQTRMLHFAFYKKTCLEVALITALALYMKALVL
jgi:hypothetical protein